MQHQTLSSPLRGAQSSPVKTMAGGTPARNFRQVFMQPWTNADQRQREVEAMRGAGVVQATRNSWVRRMTAKEEALGIKTPNRKPLADLVMPEWENTLLDGQDWRIRDQNYIYTPDAFTPLNMRHSYNEQPSTPKHYQRGSYPSTPTRIDGLQYQYPNTPLTRENSETSGAGHGPGYRAVATPVRSAAMFDAALLNTGDSFVPIPAPGTPKPNGARSGDNFSIVAEVGRTNSASNDRDEMEARLAGLSRASLLSIQSYQKSSSPDDTRLSPGNGEKWSPQSREASTASTTERVPLAEGRGAVPPPPLLDDRLSSVPWRIDYAGSLFITPFQVQQKRAEEQLAISNGSRTSSSYLPIQQLQGHTSMATRASMSDFASSNQAGSNHVYREATPTTQDMRKTVDLLPSLSLTGVQPAHKTLPHRHQHQYSQVVSPHRGAVIPSHLDAGRIGRDPFGAPSQDIEVLGLVLVHNSSRQAMIASIRPSGIAFKDGTMRVGDVLDTVNGQPLHGMDLVEIQRLFKSMTTQHVAMRLYRNVQTPRGIQKEPYNLTLLTQVSGGTARPSHYIAYPNGRAALVMMA